MRSVTHLHCDPTAAGSVQQAMSRRTLIRGSTALFAGAAALAGIAATGAATAGPAKMPQDQAKYRGAPNGPASCGKCTQFLPPSACKLVQGQISSSGWCSLFSPK